MKSDKIITRRAALARLGLGTVTAYMAPSFLGLSTARAATSASDPSPASNPTPPSKPSSASAPSAPSAPSPASTPTAASVPSQASPASGPSQPRATSRNSGPSRASGPSGPGSCRQSTLPGSGQITRDDYELAQQAISRGDARPLREVINNVQSKHPGRVLRVGFAENGRVWSFQIKIVSPSGAVVSVTVDARSGAITKVQNC